MKIKKELKLDQYENKKRWDSVPLNLSYKEYVKYMSITSNKCVIKIVQRIKIY